VDFEASAAKRQEPQATPATNVQHATTCAVFPSKGLQDSTSLAVILPSIEQRIFESSQHAQQVAGPGNLWCKPVNRRVERGQLLAVGVRREHGGSTALTAAIGPYSRDMAQAICYPVKQGFVVGAAAVETVWNEFFQD
jgi:hypothetical protein